MAKNSIRDYSATASSNTDIQSIDIDENCAASGINNAIREVMADLKDVSVGTVALESPKFDSILDGNIKATDASGTDTAGTATTIKGGAGTGTGAGGSIIFQVADGAGSTGSSVNAHATAMTITDDGNVDIANGIYLGGTASANLLDNYYEGTWSPYFSDINGNAIFNQSPTVNVGTYQRIGDFVTVHTYFGNAASVTTTASYSAGGQAYVGGLPFAVPGGAYYAGLISYQVSLAGFDTGSVSVPLFCITEGGYSVLRLNYAVGGTTAGATQNMFGNSSALILAVTYKVT